MTLGWHWILDAGGCGPEALGDVARLREVLEQLPARLGLTTVGTPQTFTHGTGDTTTLAGLVLLAESHLSLHAHPALGVLQVDLFSCAAFEPVVARAMLKARYGFTQADERLLERGGVRSRST